MSEADIERYIWTPHHTWAGKELYGICVGLRGFYMKVGDGDRIQPTRRQCPLCKGAKVVLCGSYSDFTGNMYKCPPGIPL